MRNVLPDTSKCEIVENRQGEKPKETPRANGLREPFNNRQQIRSHEEVTAQLRSATRTNQEIILDNVKLTSLLAKYKHRLARAEHGSAAAQGLLKALQAHQEQDGGDKQSTSRHLGQLQRNTMHQACSHSDSLGFHARTDRSDVIVLEKIDRESQTDADLLTIDGPLQQPSCVNICTICSSITRACTSNIHTSSASETVVAASSSSLAKDDDVSVGKGWSPISTHSPVVMNLQQMPVSCRKPKMRSERRILMQNTARLETPRTGMFMASPLDMLGRELSVFWESEQRWYLGKVVAYARTRRFPFKLLYQDGDQEWFRCDAAAELSLVLSGGRRPCRWMETSPCSSVTCA
mmetsp:Transcript_28532/g.54455  ORF Transcript_28532/g.54455 Transcript_28532/m.54455 type:complete len:349 (+) Transcript_28532:107-1153(+)